MPLQAYVGDVAIADGKIVAIGAVGTLPFVGTQVIDATGKHILPGWTDMCARLLWLFSTRQCARRQLSPAKALPVHADPSSVPAHADPAQP